MHSATGNNRHWYRSLILTVIFGGLTVFTSNTQAAETVTGRVERVWNGDTITIGTTVIRLYGIDAPERGQKCTDAQGVQYRCGAAASRILRELVKDKELRREERDREKHYTRRPISVCFVDGMDINAEMVRRGQAWAFVKYTDTYVPIEVEARQARVGIWQGNAQPAW